MSSLDYKHILLSILAQYLSNQDLQCHCWEQRDSVIAGPQGEAISLPSSPRKRGSAF